MRTMASKITSPLKKKTYKYSLEQQNLELKENLPPNGRKNKKNVAGGPPPDKRKKSSNTLKVPEIKFGGVAED